MPGTFNEILMTSSLMYSLQYRPIVKEPFESLHLVSAVVDYNEQSHCFDERAQQRDSM
jgi:hypothetical protein